METQDSNSTGNNKKVTDLDYLVKLSKGNKQFVKDMIRIFLEENPAEINTLETAIHDHDYSLINSAAHKLRSTVPFVGIDKVIANDISEIEQLTLDKSGNSVYQDERSPARLRKGRIPTDRELMTKIESLFSRIKTICARAYEELRTYA